MRRFEIVYTGLRGAPQVIQGVVFDNNEVAWVRHSGGERGQTQYEGDAVLISDCVPSGQMEPYPDLEWIDPE